MRATIRAGRVSVWVEAARPRTLTAGIVPVLVGTAVAERVIAWRFAAALVVALALQVGVNYANDYFDAAKGVDAGDRVGPRRAVASGLVTPEGMRAATIVALTVAAVAGIALAVAVEPWLLAVGAASLLAALGYSGGPKPYASVGLGELSVFAFFGLVATAGSNYVQAERLSAVALAASVPVGLLATALLVANNLRDLETDARAGRLTLAVRLGTVGTRRLFDALLIGALAAAFLVAATARSAWPLLALASFPLALAARRAMSPEDARALVPALGATARLHLAYGLLIALGLWLS